MSSDEQKSGHGRPTTLGEALILAQSIVKNPANRGEHKFSKFKYSTRNDIFEVAKPALTAAGIAMTQDVRVVSCDQLAKSKQGNDQFRCVVDLTLTLRFGAEREVVRWVGEYIGGGDNVIAGAATSAVRQALTFLLMLEIEDQESVGVWGGAEKEASAPAPPPTNNTAQHEKSLVLAGEIAGISEDCGYTGTEVGRILAAIAGLHGVADIGQVAPERLEKFVGRMRAEEPAKLAEKLAKYVGKTNE